MDYKLEIDTTMRNRIHSMTPQQLQQYVWDRWKKLNETKKN